MAVDGCPGTWAHAALTTLQYHLAALELDIKDVGGILSNELASLPKSCSRYASFTSHLYPIPSLLRKQEWALHPFGGY